MSAVYTPVASELPKFTPGDDPHKFYVRCMVNKPLHLEWAVQTPEGLHCAGISQGYNRSGYAQIRTKGIYTSSWAVKIVREHAYLRVRESGGGSNGGFNVVLARFLKEHWDELEIEIAGVEETSEYAASSIIELGRVQIPEHLIDKLEPNLNTHLFAALKYPILICIGAEGSKAWRDIPGVSPSTSSVMKRISTNESF